MTSGLNNRSPTLLAQVKHSEENMVEEDSEDLNVANLTETKSHRAPTSESVPPFSPKSSNKDWPRLAWVATLGCLIAVMFFRARRTFRTGA